MHHALTRAASHDLRAKGRHAAEIAFVDPGIDQPEALLAGLRGDVEGILLNAAEPAFAQMARALAGRRDLDAIHVVAHGAPGEVHFAAGRLGLVALEDQAAELAAVGASLAPGGELRLWSCRTAAGAQGRAFVEVLSAAIDAEVIGATGLVGSRDRGGRWELEGGIATGGAACPLTPAGAEGYRGVLSLDLAGIGNTAYTENQGSVVLFPDATLTSTFVAETQILIQVLFTSGFTSEESLSVGPLPGSTSTAGYDPELGLLSITGLAPLAEWTAVLQSIQYTNTSDEPAAVRALNITVDDLFNFVQDAAVASVFITPVNDAPVLGGAGNTLAYTENQPATAIATGLTLSDPDSATLAGATVSITGGFAGAEDVLAFTNQSGITGSYDAATGVLTLTGTATVAAYQQALRSVTYGNTSENPATLPRTISFQVDDGAGTNGLSNVATSTINVAAELDGPILVDLNGPGSGVDATTTYTENEGAVVLFPLATVTTSLPEFFAGSLSVVPLSGFTSAESLSFGTLPPSIEGTYDAANGVLTFGASAATNAELTALLRSIRYTNTSNDPVAERSFVVTLQDLVGVFAQATSSVIITAVNVAPSNLRLEGDTEAENSPAGTVVGVFSATDPDPGDTLTYTLLDDAGGAFRLEGAVLVVNGPLDFEAGPTRAVQVQVTDAAGESIAEWFTINLLDRPGVTIDGTSGADRIGPSRTAPGQPLPTVEGDVIRGFDGDDVLDGGLGGDTLIGGVGNDVYVVNEAGDVVVELSGEGTDRVNSAISYTLGDEVENLRLTGTAATDGTGNDLANRITGNAADNVLTGLDGDDVLNGGLGADTLIGGTGNDVYLVDEAGDVVVELSGEGIDRVNSAISYTLGAEVENLTLTGTAAVDGTGNALANRIVGNAADNVLAGLDGNDVLNGGDGDDVLIGGSGRDVMAGGAGADDFVFLAVADSAVGLADRINGFNFAEGDRIDLSGIDADGDASNGMTDFTWIGGGAFTGVGELRAIQAPSGLWRIEANVAGSLGADMQIVVQSGTAATAEWFGL